jgi:polyisoprenoid-binding protein YceI
VSVARYVIDKSSSRFTVRAYATGMLSAFGHNPTIAIRDFNGEVGFSPEAPAQGSLHLEIRADSLEVTDDISGKDRSEMERAMNQDVLESAKYPKIVYESSGVSATAAGEGRYRANINGNLSLHGATEKQPVVAQVTLSGDMLRASGEFTISQAAYGMKLVSVAGGTLKLKDELKFNFEIVAREG